MHVLRVQTRIHGRVLVDDGLDPSSTRLLVAFHGYAQSAEDILAEARKIPGVERWRIVAVQGLHQFYARDQRTTVASWMTRQDRDVAIADNVHYVDRVIDDIEGAHPVFVGFSQGAPMAYRAAVLGRHGARGVIALGGDIPPELHAADRARWPPVLIGAGHADTWYTAAKLHADIELLQSRGVTPTVVRFQGGHEWAEAFREEAGRWIEELA